MTENLLSLDTQSSSELAAIVAQMDPDLEYIRDLHAAASSCRTLLVKRNGEECTFKIRKLSRNMWDDTYFYYEISALRRTAERRVPGVPLLLAEYKDDQFHAIAKSFVHGTPGNAIDSNKLLADAGFIARLDALYLKLHLAGIAKIHFLPRKIVIGDDGEITLVDLSTCLVNTECGIQLFVQAMRDDSRFITRLERKLKH